MGIPKPPDPVRFVDGVIILESVFHGGDAALMSPAEHVLEFIWFFPVEQTVSCGQ